MKLEQQVTSLEISKKLKELGVKQDSYFRWCERADKMGWYIEKSQQFQEGFSAFTVAELGEMLPEGFASDRADGEGRIYWVTDNSSEIQSISAETEADARGKMLIYLLENKLLKQ